MITKYINKYTLHLLMVKNLYQDQLKFQIQVNETIFIKIYHHCNLYLKLFHYLYIHQVFSVFFPIISFPCYHRILHFHMVLS